MAVSREVPADDVRAEHVVCRLEAARPALLAEWEALAATLDAGPTLRPWWFALLRQHGPVTADLLAVTARRGRELASLLPLVHQRGVVRSPTSWDTPTFGILAADEASAVAAAQACLGLPCRRVDLSFVPEADLARFSGAARDHGRRVLARPLEVAPFVDLSAGWEALERGLSRNFRQFTRRRTRQLERAGEVAFERVEDPARVRGALDVAFRIEASGWKGEQRSAALYKPEQLRFYTAMALEAAEAGHLALDFLTLDGTAIAMCLGLEGGGTYHLMKTGYDEAYSRFSPGQVLLRALVKRAAERGLRVFDFLGGGEEYKRRWTDQVETRSRFQAFAAGAPGLVDWAAFAYGRPLAKRVLAAVR